MYVLPSSGPGVGTDTDIWQLLRRFDFETIYPKNPWHETNFNMFFHSKLWMRVTERFPDSSEA